METRASPRRGPGRRRRSGRRRSVAPEQRHIFRAAWTLVRRR